MQITGFPPREINMVDVTETHLQGQVENHIVSLISSADFMQE